MPRRTVRLRLTLLYGGLFLASGAALLAITYVLVVHNTRAFIFQGQNGNSNSFVVSSNRAAHPLQPSGLRTRGNGARGTQPTLTSQRARAQVRQLDAQARQQHSNILHQLLVQSAIALGVMALASIALGWIVAGRVLRPLRTITATAREISSTNLHQRLALDRPADELKDLGDTFDGLLARLEAAFVAQRQFVANASHELRTPLARQRTVAQVALADPDATVDSLRAAHERILASGSEQERLLEALLTLSRGHAGLDTREPVDLATVTEQVLHARHLEAERRGLELHVAIATAPSQGAPRLVERLVANLLDNALQHNVPGGRIEVTTETRADRAVLSVANTGPVVPSNALDRLFEPFQRLGDDRTRPHEGLGLGLCIVQAIANAHDATLTAQPRADGGLRIEVGFPRRAASPGQAAMSAKPASLRDRQGSSLAA
jgi:signal transduction histidine kinase